MLPKLIPSLPKTAYQKVLLPNIGKTLQFKCPSYEWVMSSCVVIQKNPTSTQLGVIYPGLGSIVLKRLGSNDAVTKLIGRTQTFTFLSNHIGIRSIELSLIWIFFHILLSSSVVTFITLLLHLSCCVIISTLKIPVTYV